MKRFLSALALVAALYVAAQAQTLSFDEAVAHQHGEPTVETFLWVGRTNSPSAVPFRFIFLGNVMRLQNAAEEETRLYYDFDFGPRISENTRIIYELERKWVKVTYDRACGMVLSFEAGAPPPPPDVQPKMRATKTPAPPRKQPRRKPAPRQ